RSSKTLSGAPKPSPELQHPRRRCGRPKCSSHPLRNSEAPKPSPELQNPLRSSNTLGDGAGGPSAAPTPSTKLPNPLRISKTLSGAPTPSETVGEAQVHLPPSKQLPSSKTLSGAPKPSPELQHPRRRCGR